MNRPAEFDADLVAAIPRLSRYANKFGQVSGDLVQETLMRAMTHWEQFKPGTNFNGWLFVICRNSYLNGARRSRRLIFDSEAADAAQLSVPAPQDDVAMARECRVAMAGLSAEHREILEMAGDGLTEEEMSHLIPGPIGTLKSRLSRARVRLVEAVGTP